ncbi:RDD family protein [Streptomyces pratens]|uniref:RDD family protein n=1 Tax=Streptomyces pratens TaxID=887456 RepID=A0ABW1M5I1_9ACTN
MSAPTPAPGDDTPREGFYPDPSIPGYVRYWNGASWVPGTSRPAPDGGGAPLASSASAGAGSSASTPAVPVVEETGPHFFDEDPVDGPPPSPPFPSPSQVPSPSSPFSPSPLPADSQHGSRPEPASAWSANRSHQSGFGGDQDRRVSWGADPRVAHASGPAGGESTGAGGADAGAAPAGNTFGSRPPTAKPPTSADSGSAGASAASDSAIADEGTMTFRAVGPRQGSGAASSGSGSSGSSGRPGFGAGKAAAARAARTASGQEGSGSSAAAPVSGPQQASTAPAVPPQSMAPEPMPAPAAAPAPASVPAQASASRPLSSGHGGGQSSWAQQVHRPADGEAAPVAPWKPPVEDIFQAAARRQASARPAGFGKRLVARLLDTVILGGVTALAAVPLGLAAADHVNEKIDAAKLSGETVTVWLLDGTTSVYLGIVLAVLLLGGVLCEVLPTAKWGCTPGKKLLGLEVRDIEGHDVPGFGAALRRWLVYSIPGLLVVGVVGVLWCLFDKPWRQCWHDKVAHTFVAG